VRFYTPELLGENASGRTFQLEARKTARYLVCYRYAGSVSGNHYHEGKLAGKHPEQLLLLQGQARIEWRGPQDADKQTQTLEAPMRIDIDPFVRHWVVALTDLLFLELNSLEDHQRDTLR
jgi:hypothetical protein